LDNGTREALEECTAKYILSLRICVNMRCM